MPFQTYTRQQIEAMPDQAIKPAYERVKGHLSALQRKSWFSSEPSSELTEEINAAIRQYVWLRGRKFPDYFED